MPQKIVTDKIMKADIRRINEVLKQHQDPQVHSAWRFLRAIVVTRTAGGERAEALRKECIHEERVRVREHTRQKAHRRRVQTECRKFGDMVRGWMAAPRVQMAK